MRAFALDDFGGSATLRDMPAPMPEEGDVRVRVLAAGVNPLDSAIARGAISPRVKEAMRARLPLVLGMDVSGIVDLLGPGVDTVAVGDEVYGLPGKPFFGCGTFADLAVVSASTIAHKPASLCHREAAAVPMAAMTALTAMDIVQPLEGETVLVVRAAGGVGSFVVQMCAARGAHVIGVARAANVDYVRGLGAAEVIDYERTDPALAAAAHHPEGLDVVVDLLGGREALTRLLGVVREGGRVACVSRPPEDVVAARRIRAEVIMAVATTDRLARVARLLDTGELRPPEIRSLPLDRALEALEESGRGHVRGKLVLTLPAGVPE
jgi:NADPH:quinone reductase-like Zn-dependent oxidoreductase